MGRFIHFALAASAEAMAHSGLQVTEENPRPHRRPHRLRHRAASTSSSANTPTCSQAAPRKVSPFFIPGSIINLAAGHVSIKYGARGPNEATATACTTSAHAIGDAFRLIQRGDAEVMIAGGNRSPPSHLWESLASPPCAPSSTRNEDPEHASRPFDKDRDGFVVGRRRRHPHPRRARVRQGARCKRSSPRSFGYGLSADAFT